MFIWKFYECRIQFCKICTLYYSHQLNIFISKSSDIIIKEIMIIYLLYSSLEMNSHDDNKGVQMFANFLHPVSRCLVLPLSLSVRQGMMVSQGRWNWLVVVTKLAKNLNINFTKNCESGCTVLILSFNFTASSETSETTDGEWIRCLLAEIKKSCWHGQQTDHCPLQTGLWIRCLLADIMKSCWHGQQTDHCPLQTGIWMVIRCLLQTYRNWVGMGIGSNCLLYIWDGVYAVC